MELPMPMKIYRSADPASQIVILITLVLFVVALFTKGFTHDLLLEVGVFLVSVKLILMSYKTGQTAEKLLARLDEMQASLNRLESEKKSA